ncbi:MAG TPA: DUF2793 domain-containing protein [Patescibacteria group bacterium]|nr:DUF2793 domain-containing protein [Patescibacteria group bacterium]
MADFKILSRLINGLNRNVDLSTNTLILGNVKIGGETNYATFDVSALDAARTITMPNANVDLGGIATNASAISTHLNGEASKHDATEIDFEYADGSKKNIQAASDTVEAAIQDLDTAIGALAATPTNYTPASPAIVASHLAAIDSAIGTALGSDFSDAVFRISDNTTASKKIAFEASGISESTVRTITMPDANVDLGHIANLTTLSGVAAASTHLGTFTGAIIEDSRTIKQALQDLETSLSNTQGVINNFEWQESALSYVADNTAAPATEVTGDRYILSHDGGAPHADYDGASAGDIVEFNGTSWIAVTPSVGTFIAVDDEANKLYVWGGSSWSSKYFESTTASGLLTKDVFDVKFATSTAANIIVYNASGIASAVAMSSEATISDAGAVTLSNAAVIGKVLTGFTSGVGTVTADDSLLSAIQKIDANANAAASAASDAQADVDDLVTLSGVAVNAEHLGTFTGSTIADSSTIKSALQSLETAVEGASASSNKIEKTCVAGFQVPANSSRLVRYALSSETAGRVYLASKPAGAAGSETNTIYVIGLAQNRTASAIEIGSNVPVIILGEATLQSSDSSFESSEVGLPIFLGDSGAFDVATQLTFSSNDASVWCAQVKTVGIIEIKQSQILGIN